MAGVVQGVTRRAILQSTAVALSSVFVSCQKKERDSYMVDTRQSLQQLLLPAPRHAGFRMDNYWIWCGSVVRGEDRRFHMFASRWPRSLPFHPGWLTSSEVIRAVSDTLEGPYAFAEVVLPARGNGFWDGDSTHNPHIVKNGSSYILFYMGTRTPLESVDPAEPLALNDPRVIVARSSKRIGIATAESIQGPWTRLDSPVFGPAPDTYYSYFVSNPAPIVNPDGSVFLAFKSRKYLPSRKHSDMMLGAATAPRPSGPYRVITPEPIFGGDGRPAVEDPYIWRSSRGYELIAKDMTGHYCGESGAGIRAFSADGIKWQLDAPSKSWSRRIEWSDKTTETVGSAERPFLFWQDGKPTHLFLSMSDGPGGFDRITRTWIQPIPLKPDAPAFLT